MSKSLSFGIRFGQLIKSKRGIEGLTQQQLAVLAFGDESQKTRISELENGKVNSPHQKTVDALVVALLIRAEELASCLDEIVTTLPKKLLVDLARKFGAENPNASIANCITFLKGKAKDYRGLKLERDKITKLNDKVSDQLNSAISAIDDGDFDQADTLVMQAEEVRLETEFVSKIKQYVDLRAYRAQIQLLKGDIKKAANLFRSAATISSEFDPILHAQLLSNYARMLLEYGVQYGSDAITLSVDFFQQSFDLWDSDKYSIQWLENTSQFARALRFLGQRSGTLRGIECLLKSVEFLQYVQKAYALNSMQSNWIDASESLSISYFELGKLVPVPKGLEYFASAANEANQVLQATSNEQNLDAWITAKNLIGNVSLEVGMRTQAITERKGHFKKALKEYRSALQFLNEDSEYMNFAMVQNNLGLALREVACLEPTENSGALLVEATEAFLAALNYRTKRTSPMEWSVTLFNLGACYDSRSTHEPENYVEHLIAALSCFEQCLEVLNMNDSLHQFEATINAKLQVINKLPSVEVDA